MAEVDPASLPADAMLLVVSSLALIGFPPPFPGCERRACAGCGRDVWAAPSTLRAEQLRTVLHACQRCALAAADELGGVSHVERLRGADDDVRQAGSLVTSESEADHRTEFVRKAARRLN